MNRDNEHAEIIKEGNALFIGRRNAGKTTIFHASSMSDSIPIRDAVDGTDECETSGFKLDSTYFKLIDTKGFRGSAKEDDEVLEKIRREVRRAGVINALFIVTSYHRFENHDNNVINFIVDRFSRVAKNSSYLIIMSCGDSERSKAISQYITTTRFGKISLFGGPENNYNRVLNFDLPSFSSFPEESVRPVIQARYEVARDRVREEIAMSKNMFMYEELIRDSYCNIS